MGLTVKAGQLEEYAFDSEIICFDLHSHTVLCSAHECAKEFRGQGHQYYRCSGASSAAER